MFDTLTANLQPTNITTASTQVWAPGLLTHYLSLQLALSASKNISVSQCLSIKVLKYCSHGWVPCTLALGHPAPRRLPWPECEILARDTLRPPTSSGTMCSRKWCEVLKIHSHYCSSFNSTIALLCCWQKTSWVETSFYRNLLQNFERQAIVQKLLPAWDWRVVWREWS